MRNSIPRGARVFFSCRDNIIPHFVQLLFVGGKNVEKKKTVYFDWLPHFFLALCPVIYGPIAPHFFNQALHLDFLTKHGEGQVDKRDLEQIYFFCNTFPVNSK